LFFDPAGLINSSRRLRVEGERLHAKIVKLEAFIAGGPGPVLVRKLDVLRREHDRVQVKRRMLHREISHLAGRWVSEQAVAHGCGRVVLEDLATLEPKGGTSKDRARASQQLRGQTDDGIADAVSDTGLALDRIDPRNTSARCSRCGATRRFVTCPSGKAGTAWAVCDGCGWTADRDHAGSEGILGKAFDPAGLMVMTTAAPRREPTPRRTPSRPAHRRHQETRAAAKGRATPRQPKHATPPTPGRRVTPVIPHVDRALQQFPELVTQQATRRPAAGPYRPVRTMPQADGNLAQAGDPAPQPSGVRATSPGAHHSAPARTRPRTVRDLPGPCDGTRYAYRTRLRATPIPAGVGLIRGKPT
jgi:hypothetical protein